MSNDVLNDPNCELFQFMMASNFTLKCSSCDAPEEALYSCETCEESIGGSPQPESSHKPSKKRRKTEDFSKSKGLCDSCILQHIRKDHEVKNLKGQTPVICSVHKNLHSEYCRTCDVTFCLKCLGDHRDHQLGSVEEREKELRKEIFEILTESELSEKPLQTKLKSMAGQRDHDRLVEVVTTETKLLADALIGLVDKKYENDRQKGDNLINTVGELQSEARNLLSNEGCQLIRDFRSLKSRSLDCTNRTEAAISENYTCKRSNTVVLGEEFQIFRQKMIKKLMPKADDQFSFWWSRGAQFERYSCSFNENRASTSYRVLLKGGALIIEQISDISEGKVKSKTQMTCRPYRRVVKSVFFHHEMSEVIIQLDNGYLDLLTGGNYGYKTETLNISKQENFLCFYMFKKEVHQCYWNSAAKLICLTHNENEFECEAMPKLISSEISPFIFLHTSEHEIIAYDFRMERYIYVPFVVHGCDSIDYITTFSCSSRSKTECLFFMWSVNSNCVTILEWNNYSGCNLLSDGKKQWTDPSQPIQFSHSFGHRSTRFTLVPAIRVNEGSNGSENCLQYVYAVLVL